MLPFLKLLYFLSFPSQLHRSISVYSPSPLYVRDIGGKNRASLAKMKAIKPINQSFEIGLYYYYTGAPKFYDKPTLEDRPIHDYSGKQKKKLSQFFLKLQ